jgi:cyclohexadienyl dehydratase
MSHDKWHLIRTVEKGSYLLVAAVLSIFALGFALPSQAQAVEQRVRATLTLRVCIWPDYFGVSYRDPRTGLLTGIDIDLSRHLAEDLGVKVRYVDSSFPALVEDVLGDRCDLAMFAVGVLPQRAAHLWFTRPYLASGIYGVTTRSNRVVSRWSDIDRPGVAVAVAAGTFMEPVMKAELKQARLISIKPPDTRERELEAGRVDVFMTDFPYSRRLIAQADWAVLVEPPEPFHVVPYAIALKPGDEAWRATLDRFVARIQNDGRLMAAAVRHGLQPIVLLR